MKWRIPLAIVIFACLGQFLHTVGAMATMKFYQMPDYAGVWSRLMMSEAGPPGVNFYVYSALFALVGAFLALICFLVVRKAFSGDNLTAIGVKFGLLALGLAIIPSLFMMILLFNLPLILPIVWTIESTVQFILGGIIFAYLLKPIKI